MSSSAQGNVGSQNRDGDSGSTHDRNLRWVGKYRILSELGRGGMSNVYLAVARGPGGVNKLVVLKAVLPELASEPGALAMFLDEARLGAQLNHANVVQTYEVGTEGDRHVIVMEYLEGQTLAHIIRRAEQNGTPMSTSMLLRIIISALEGLHYAHELSAYDGSPLLLVHRDISPQNIFVTYGGQVKVLDFGIAKASSSSTHTATGVVKGKIAYMAPEQMIADSLDRRADVYSVGCMLWAAGTGRKLWKDTPDVQIMRRVINGDIPTPQSINMAVDDDFNHIVMTAVAADPEQRFQTALALQEALEQYSERFSSPVKQKEIGAFVSMLFADVRAELKALVERQLTLAMNDEPSDTGSDVRLYGPANGWQTRSGESNTQQPNTQLSSSGVAHNPALGNTGSNAILGGTDEDDQAKVAARRRRVPLYFGAALLLLGSAAALLLRPAASPAPAAAPVGAADPKPSAAPIAAPVNLQFKASPSEAELFLDDQRLATNPASSSLPADGRLHRLRAEANGYETSSAEFSAIRDETVQVDLKKSAVSPTKIGTATPAHAHHAKSATIANAPSAPVKVDCRQAFFVGPDGIKKVRPECL